jgi:hypothetical protein
MLKPKQRSDSAGRRAFLKRGAAMADALVSGIGSLTSAKPVRTVRSY